MQLREIKPVEKTNPLYEIVEKLNSVTNEEQRKKVAHQLIQDSIQKFHAFYSVPLQQVLDDFLSGKPNSFNVFELRRKYPHINSHDIHNWNALGKHLKELPLDEMNDYAKLLLARIYLNECKNLKKNKEASKILDLLSQVCLSKDNNASGIAYLYLAEFYKKSKKKKLYNSSLEESFQKGNAIAMRLLANNLKYNPQHYSKCNEWYVKALQSGDYDSAFELVHLELIRKRKFVSPLIDVLAPACISLDRGNPRYFENIGDMYLLEGSYSYTCANEAVKCWEYAATYFYRPSIFEEIGKKFLRNELKSIRQGEYLKEKSKPFKLTTNHIQKNLYFEELKTTYLNLQQQDFNKGLYYLRKAVEMGKESALAFLRKKLITSSFNINHPVVVYHMYMIIDFLKIESGLKNILHANFHNLINKLPKIFDELAKDDHWNEIERVLEKPELIQATKMRWMEKSRLVVDSLSNLPKPLVKETLGYLGNMQMCFGFFWNADKNEKRISELKPEIPRVELFLR